MSIEVIVATQVSGIGGVSVGGRRTLTGDAAVLQDIAIAAAAEDVEVTLAFKVTDLTAGGLLLLSDVPLTVKTNSTSSPGDTYSVPAGGCLDVGTISADITRLYVSNEDADTAGTLYLRGARDSTP